MRLLALRFLGEFFLDVNSVARNILTALTEEKPSKDEDGTAKSKQAVFDWIWPVGGKENDGVNKTDTKSIDTATGENNFFGKWEVTASKGIFSTIIWVAKYFTIYQQVTADR